MSDVWAMNLTSALAENGWEIEPGVDWDDRRILLGPGRLAKGYHLALVYSDMVTFGEFRVDGSCEYEHTRGLPDSFHELIDLVAEMNAFAARGEPL